MIEKTENGRTYDVGDILDVTPVRMSSFRVIFSDQNWEFTVRLRDGTIHNLCYGTQFEAYAVREALFGTLCTVRGVRE